MAKRTKFRMALSGLKAALTPTTVESSYANCTIFSTEPMTCPLCQKLVKANTVHRCEKKS
jgi:hypothetical protein